MRLVSCRVRHHRSIDDSGLVEFDPEITNIVGVTGSGKTSFLEMLSGVSTKVMFGVDDLPHNSEVLTRFHEGRVPADKIVQLEAVFSVEDSDVPRLPEKYRHARRITLRRAFDGGITLAVDGTPMPRADIEAEANEMRACAARVAKCLSEQSRGHANGGDPFLRSTDDLVRSFCETDFYSRGETMLAINSLSAAAYSAPRPRSTMSKIDDEIMRMQVISLNIANKIDSDRSSALYKSIPKPKYYDKPFELEDEIGLDQFIKNPTSSKTFLYVAQICGLAPAFLATVRTAGASERDAYLEAKSAELSARLNEFWRQEKYAFKLAIDGSRLRLHVRDSTTGTTTPLTERSDGFRWWLAFFLYISTLLASDPGRSIILLDNPATELHERGKGDFLRFIQEAAGSGRMQIVYSTHDRALIDPWRTDCIRVATLTRGGTRIKTVRAAAAAASSGMLEAVMKGIGSPARYSLFGAQRTVSFEGVSDTYIASAVNEYLARTNPGAALDKDTYSINSVGGIGNARHTWQVYNNLDIDFVIVVDRGNQSAGLSRRIGVEEFGRHFVELPAVPGKREVDIEDLVDRVLYYEAFECAYRGILDTVPAMDEIDGDVGQRRSVNYAGWLKRSGMSFNKALAAQCMFSVMLGDGPGRGAQGRGAALERTAEAFAGLFATIKERFEGGPERMADPAAPCPGP